MKRKLTKNSYEKVPVVSSFSMSSKRVNLSHLEDFDKKCVRDFVERIIYLQEFI